MTNYTDKSNDEIRNVLLKIWAKTFDELSLEFPVMNFPWSFLEAIPTLCLK